jgi:hypothetical protein
MDHLVLIRECMVKQGDITYRRSGDRNLRQAGYNRFLVPPAALAVHLSIGQAYAFSTFNLPLTKLIGITQSAPGRLEAHRRRLDLLHRHRHSRASAAVFGRWVERVGPRKIHVHRGAVLRRRLHRLRHGHSLPPALDLLYLGYGVLGGCGLGIGYISPVSTLIKWFPDRPGMATGMAIMGFGGGALIAAPLSVC